VAALNHAKDLHGVLKDTFKYDESIIECEAGVSMCYIHVPVPNITMARYIVTNMTVIDGTNSKVCRIALDMFNNGSLFHKLTFDKSVSIIIQLLFLHLKIKKFFF